MEAHQPVLYHEIIHALRPVSGGRYVDCTVGAGGHAHGILMASAPDGCLLGLDVDPQALSLAQARLATFGERVRLVRASYVTLKEQLAVLGWESGVDGILLDLGASSLQFDTPQRGFSFLEDGPLDMRFDPENPLTAAEIVNAWPEEALAEVIYRYGEEPAARRIARAIVSARPIQSTRQLATLVERVAGRHRAHHPATQTFQALRIVVNDELAALERVLPQAVQALKPGGRLAIIAFHSLEDRRVKEFFRRESRDCLCPPRQVVCTCGHRASLRLLDAHPLRPKAEEIQRNPRARSARLRVAEKI
jgi:16S rRNA (cytosine1402-N4)-methyltransferase